jgi:hypothetical protein
LTGCDGVVVGRAIDFEGPEGFGKVEGNSDEPRISSPLSHIEGDSVKDGKTVSGHELNTPLVSARNK